MKNAVAEFDLVVRGPAAADETSLEVATGEGTWREDGRPATLRDGALPIRRMRAIQIERGAGVFHRVMLTVLLAMAAHELPSEGLETDELIGRFKRVAKWLIESDITGVDRAMG